jgi:4-hydroxybenzoate polyprenyltransferase
MLFFNSVNTHKFYPADTGTHFIILSGEIILYHSLRRLIRFEAYGILFMLAGLFGALLANASFDGLLAVLLIFIAASSAFGFVINDISDVALDARLEKTRNPLADGSLSCWVAWIISGIFLAISLACMAILPSSLFTIELAVLFVFFTYSFIIEAKNIAGLDLVYHALFPALYGLIGYVLSHPFDLTGFVFTILLGIFGAIGEMGNEIRDHEKDRHVRNNTVVFIGERLSFILTIGLMLSAFVIITFFAVIQPGYFWLIPFVPFGIFLVHPVYQAMKIPGFRETFVDMINSRAIILAVVMLLVYTTIRFFGVIR